jgi:rhodanese-related sulfurtransferase
MYAKVIDRNEFYRLKDKKSTMVIDMRSPIEYRDGHIDEAVNLPLRNFLNTITPLNRDTKLILYADIMENEDLVAGVRYAAQLGFDSIYTTAYSEILCP